MYCFIYRKVRSSARDSTLKAFSFLSLLFLCLHLSSMSACMPVSPRLHLSVKEILTGFLSVLGHLGPATDPFLSLSFLPFTADGLNIYGRELLQPQAVIGLHHHHLATRKKRTFSTDMNTKLAGEPVINSIWVMCPPWILLYKDTRKYGLLQWLSSKEPICNAGDTGDMGSVPESETSPGGRAWQTRPPSILAWTIPWTEEPGGLSPWGHKELDRTEAIEYTHMLILKYGSSIICLLLWPAISVPQYLTIRISYN